MEEVTVAPNCVLLEHF